jgi:glycosyltransferase involved in cell wall biosynthesis
MTRPDRIVFVLSKYSVGGLEKQLANLLLHRPERARHVEIHTITLQAARSDEVQRRFERAGAVNTLVNREELSFPRFFLGLLGAMRRLRPVAVSTLLDSSAGAWGRLAAWLTRVPVIVHSDRLLATEGTRAHYLLRPFLDRVTDRFLPNAHAIADRLVETGVARDKIRVMPNGVDLDVFDPASAASLRADWGIGEDATVVGYLGRFAELKRVDLLLEAATRLPEADRPDLLVLAGDGPTLPRIRATIDADPWLARHVRLLGSIDDTPAFLRSIDYLVLPSESEGLPNVVLEAMAMGRPVVATRVSDVPVLVSDTGLLVPPSDGEALAGALADMQARGREGREALGRAARARIEAEYDIVTSAARFWDAHLELLPGRGHAAPAPAPDRTDAG